MLVVVALAAALGLLLLGVCRRSGRSVPAAGERSRLIAATVEPANLLRGLSELRVKSAAGADGLTPRQFLANAQGWMEEVRSSLVNGIYQPAASIVYPKPKGGGGVRDLHVETVRDRYVGRCLLGVLGPLLEGSFHERSLGYRPGRNTAQAIRRIRRIVGKGHTYGVSTDVHSFFASIDRGILRNLLLEAVGGDAQFTDVILAYLHAPMLVNRVERPGPAVGIYEGSTLSPILSNLYINQVDWLLSRNGVNHVRYADNIILLGRTAQDCQDALELTTGFLGQSRGLRLKAGTTGVVHLAQSPLRVLGLDLTVDAVMIPEARIVQIEAAIDRRRSWGKLSQKGVLSSYSQFRVATNWGELEERIIARIRTRREATRAGGGCSSRTGQLRESGLRDPAPESNAVPPAGVRPTPAALPQSTWKRGGFARRFEAFRPGKTPQATALHVPVLPEDGVTFERLKECVKESFGTDMVSHAVTQAIGSVSRFFEAPVELNRLMTQATDIMFPLCSIKLEVTRDHRYEKFRRRRYRAADGEGGRDRFGVKWRPKSLQLQVYPEQRAVIESSLDLTRKATGWVETSRCMALLALLILVEHGKHDDNATIFRQFVHLTGRGVRVTSGDRVVWGCCMPELMLWERFGLGSRRDRPRETPESLSDVPCLNCYPLET